MDFSNLEYVFVLIFRENQLQPSGFLIESRVESEHSCLTRSHDFSGDVLCMLEDRHHGQPAPTSGNGWTGPWSPFSETA